jgi:2',3'-cyclic-nucleotide 2'-phosphodiesterase (5'-nucleotidase family)
MMNSLLCAGLLLGTVPYVSGESTDIYLGDVNVVVLTDVHGWVAGHGRHDPTLDADFGDVLSFYQRLKDISTKDEHDLFFVMNGDFLDGTGLSEDPPTSLIPILEKMPFDALNVGNHDIANHDTVKYLTEPSGFVQWWEGNFLTSNVVKAGTSIPMGARYALLHGSFKKSKILTLGFIYDYLGAPKNLLEVENVAVVVESAWFKDVVGGVHGDYNAIMVLAQMDINDDLVQVILSAIRSITGENMPVQFITGHTHYRDSKDLDNYSSAYQAGRYLDTIGFVSFPIKKNNGETDGRKHFKHSYINANRDDLRATLDVKKLHTEEGSELSIFIKETEEAMGLLKLEGCAPMTYVTEANENEDKSIWRLYMKEVIPSQIAGWDESIDRFLTGTASLRSDLFQGQVLKADLLSVAPFHEKIYKLRDNIPGWALLQLYDNMGQEKDLYHNGNSELPDYLFNDNVAPLENYTLYTTEYYSERIIQIIESAIFAETFQDEEAFVPVKASGISSTSIWFRFVKENWSDCPVEPEESEDPEDPNIPDSTTLKPETKSNTKSWAIGMSVIVILLVAFVSALAVLHYKKKQKKKRREQENVTTPAVYRDSVSVETGTLV